MKILIGSDNNIVYSSGEAVAELITENVSESKKEAPPAKPTTSNNSIAAGIEGPAFVISKYGTRQLVLKQHTFNRHVSREDVTYWRCSQFAVLRCRARIKTKANVLTVLNGQHNHEVILKARKYGSLKQASKQQQAAAANMATNAAAAASAAGKTDASANSFAYDSEEVDEYQTDENYDDVKLKRERSDRKNV